MHIISDRFDRTVAAGWDTSSDGNAWTAQTGTGTLSVTPSQGQLNQSTAFFQLTIGSQTGIDSEILFRWSITDNTLDGARSLQRWQDVNNYYTLGFATPLGAGAKVIRKVVAGATTDVASVAFSPVAGTFYWCRARVQTNVLSVKIWQDGTTEPAAFDLSTTDGSFAGAGNFGALLAANAASAAVSTVDTYSVDNLLPVNPQGVHRLLPAVHVRSLSQVSPQPPPQPIGTPTNSLDRHLPLGALFPRSRVIPFSPPPTVFPPVRPSQAARIRFPPPAARSRSSIIPPIPHPPPSTNPRARRLPLQASMFRAIHSTMVISPPAAPSPPAGAPPAIAILFFRSGRQTLAFRTGAQRLSFRSGLQQLRYRTGQVVLAFRNGILPERFR